MDGFPAVIAKQNVWMRGTLLPSSSPRDLTINGLAWLGGSLKYSGLLSNSFLTINGGLMFDDNALPAAYNRSLSIRRREILMLAGKGHLDKQIGEQLNISESTVRNHWQHIFVSLDAANRTEAVVKAIRMGLI